MSRSGPFLRNRIVGDLGLVVLMAVWTTRSPAWAAAPVVVMEMVGQLEGPSTASMSQPSDVVAAKSGEVWVLDGVNERLARFSPEGRFRGYVNLPEVPGSRFQVSSFKGAVPGGQRAAALLSAEDEITSAVREVGERPALPESRERGGGRAREFPVPVGPEEFLPPLPMEGMPALPRPERQKPTTSVEEIVLPPERPAVGLGMDEAGHLLVGNRETGMIDILDGQGKLQSSVSIPREEGEVRVDPTDVAVRPAAQSFLVVDNDNHCIKEIDGAGRLIRRIGKRGTGSGSGEMYYPATAAFGPDGRLMVVDVLNARVDVFDREGLPLRPIGSRGVVAGRFYRPKGVAVDRAGRLHVTDSFTGLVQVFDMEGRLIGVWGAASGQPHRLRSPASIFVDEAGRFYVVEMLANCVTVWRERR